MTSRTILASLIALLLLNPAQAAEEEILLTITDDRIDVIIEGEASGNADDLVLRYYELLTLEKQEQLQTLRRRMNRRMEDYEVAFAAADTAEVNEIVDDLSAYWTRIQQIHYEEFTPAAMAQLQAAYAELFFLIAE